MKRVRVALCVCTRLGSLLLQVPRHVRIDICEHVGQRRLGALLSLRQRIHHLGAYPNPASRFTKVTNHFLEN